MVNFELAHWINEKRDQKFSDDQIKSNLSKHGYSQEIIDQAFDSISSHTKEEIKMGKPPISGGMQIGTGHYDTLAIIALVSLFFFPLIALPLGVLSLIHIKHNSNLKGKAFAIVGIIIGAIPLLFFLLYIFIFFMAIITG